MSACLIASSIHPSVDGPWTMDGRWKGWIHPSIHMGRIVDGWMVVMVVKRQTEAQHGN